MFGFLGQLIRRGWFLLLAAWVILLLVTRAYAPPWQTVAEDKEFAFLPAQSPSRVADEIFQKAFPDEQSGSNIVLLIHRVDGQDRLEADRKFIEDVIEPRVRQIAAAEGGLARDESLSEDPLFPGDDEPAAKPASQRSIIERIRTPNALGTGALLISPDHQVLLVTLELTTEFLSNKNWPTITRVEDMVQELKQEAKVPHGLDLAITGSAVIGRDHTVAELQSARATEVLTVVLVVVLLVLIYRAPLLALIPLATVYLAVQVSLNLLALMAGAGYLTLFQGIQIYITILAYGAGVDFCLFLTARYKEELDSGRNPADAVANAVKDVGAALTASAFTVIGGIGMMMFAQFGKFREAGYAIPIALFLVLCATLTFSASLLRLAGRWAFWPYRPEPHPDGPASGPAPAASFLRRVIRGEELQELWDRVGRMLSRRPGRVWLVTVALMSPFVVVAFLFYSRLSYDIIGDLPPNAPSVVGTRILQQHFPAGIIGQTKVLLVNKQVDFSGSEGRRLVEQVTNCLRKRGEELGLADVRSLTAPLGITPAAKDAFAGFHVSEETRREALERTAVEHYVTDLGERAKVGTRFDLTLNQSPFSHAAVSDLDRVDHAIRASLPPERQNDSDLYFAGPTPSVRDLQNVMRQDRLRIEMLVLASVFVILVLLLRQFAVPLYLLASVLFSYYATLGTAFLVFWLLDPAGFTGIDWKVAIFLFTILIAVGEDYNIFLIARVHEEQRRYGPVRGIIEALARTGPIISSCGIIMAGTFASLMAGSLIEMKQLGFALAFGILLDTFVVRPILVPAFLILRENRRLKNPRGPAAVPVAAEQSKT